MSAPTNRGGILSTTRPNTKFPLPWRRTQDVPPPAAGRIANSPLNHHFPKKRDSEAHLLTPSPRLRAPSRVRRDPTPCLAHRGGGGESAPHRKCILRPELAPRRRVPALGRQQATGSRIHMASGVRAAPPRPAPSPALHRSGLASSPQPRGQQRRSPRGCQERGPLCTPGRNEQVSAHAARALPAPFSLDARSGRWPSQQPTPVPSTPSATPEAQHSQGGPGHDLCSQPPGRAARPGPGPLRPSLSSGREAVTCRSPPTRPSASAGTGRGGGGGAGWGWGRLYRLQRGRPGRRRGGPGPRPLEARSGPRARSITPRSGALQGGLPRLRPWPPRWGRRRLGSGFFLSILPTHRK